MSSAILMATGFKRTGMALFALSGLINLLALTGALYMLQVYDRVLSSQSIPTLLALSGLAAILYLGFAVIDGLRSKVLIRLANRFDAAAMPRAQQATLRLAISGHQPAASLQPVRDADLFRQFLSGQGCVALLDLPWAPLYFCLIYVLSPTLAAVTAVGVVLLVLLAVASERAAATAERAASDAASSRHASLESSVANAETVVSMGMSEAMARQIHAAHRDLVGAQTRAGDVAAISGSASRTVRLALQSAIVGVGAALAIAGDVTSGAIIAASIAAGRALAPIEVAIAHWRSFVAARAAAARLRTWTAPIEASAAAATSHAIATPRANLTLDRVSATIPGTSILALVNIELTAHAGTIVGVAGHTASGKSAFARVLVGLSPIVRGSVRLDGTPLDRWSATDLGRHIGYLPQTLDFVPGTIAEVIARHAAPSDKSAVLSAARAAGLHDTITKLPSGYDTVIGSGRHYLTGGQRQRLGLARALYGDPFLVVLDDPSSSLDPDGEQVLLQAMRAVKVRGGIVVVMTQRKSILALADQVAVLDSGRIDRLLSATPTSTPDRVRAPQAAARVSHLSERMKAVQGASAP